VAVTVVGCVAKTTTELANLGVPVISSEGGIALAGIHDEFF
jgi:hypothetical protein